jgi:hypothetical protein
VFEPNARGVVGVVDELLAACRDQSVQLEWLDGECRVRPLGLTPEQVAELTKPRLASSGLSSASGAGSALAAALLSGEWEPEPIAVPIPKSAFRAMLARLAALCNERAPASTSPYGGEGELLVGTDAAAFRIAFTNTPGAQRAEVRFVGMKAPDPQPKSAAGGPSDPGRVTS